MSNEPPRHEVDRAREACLRLLGYRARSRRELVERLTRKGFVEAVIAAAVAELETAGLVDDQAFARAWVRERLTNSPRGSMGVRWELRRKGVRDDIIERTLEQEMGEERELAAALQVAARYRPRSGEDGTACLRRLVGALKRRGFSFDVIDEVLARARKDEGTA